MTGPYSSQKTGTDGRSRQMIVSHSFSKPFSTTTSSIVFALLLAWYVNAVCPSACRLTYPGPLSTPLAYAAMLFMPRRRVTSWFVYTTPAPSNLVLAPHHPPAHPHPWYFSTTAALLLLEHYPPRCRPSFLSRLLCRALWFSNTIPPPPACGFLPPASSWFLRTIPDVLACGFVIPQHGLVLQNHSSRPRTWFFYTNTLVVL